MTEPTADAYRTNVSVRAWIGMVVIACHNAEEALTASGWLTIHSVQVNALLGTHLGSVQTGRFLAALLGATAIPFLWVLFAHRGAQRSWQAYFVGGLVWDIRNQCLCPTYHRCDPVAGIHPRRCDRSLPRAAFLAMVSSARNRTAFIYRARDTSGIARRVGTLRRRWRSGSDLWPLGRVRRSCAHR